MSLNSKPVFIVGCGYIGKRLAHQLVDNNILVTGIVNSEASKLECKRINVSCEIQDLDALDSDFYLNGQRVIYLVPPPRNGKKDSRITKFLNAIERHRPEKLVYISTTGVYGDCKGAWIDEATPLNPKADRAFRRIDAEKQVQHYCQHHDIPLVILRVAGIYGAGKLPIARIKSGQPIVDNNDSPYTNRIHADDLVNVCEKALMNLDIVGIYNVTDGHPSTMHEYFTSIATAMDLPVPPAIPLNHAQQVLSEGMLSYMAESRRISNSLLLNDFEIQLLYPTLPEGVEQCIKEINAS